MIYEQYFYWKTGEKISSYAGNTLPRKFSQTNDIYSESVINEYRKIHSTLTYESRSKVPSWVLNLIDGEIT